MKLKLDENLGRHIAVLFRDDGHDVATVADQDLSGAEDRRIIEASRSERRCLVTLDLEFGNPLVFNHAEYAGVAVLRLGQGAPPGALLSVVRTLIGALEKESIEGRLWLVQPGRVREYQPE